MELEYGGIKFKLIQNIHIFNSYSTSLVCCFCGKLVRDPIECEDCDSIFCSSCYDFLKFTDCKPECKKVPLRANKFLRNILSTIILNCEYCLTKNIKYDDFMKHLKNCPQKNKFAIREDCISQIKALDLEIEQYEQELNKIEKETEFRNFQNFKRLDHLSDAEIREKLNSNTLSSKHKIELHNAIKENNIDLFKNLIEDKKFPINEVISEKEYFWTPIHYAMHYAKWEIISYILSYFKENNNLGLVSRLRCSDGRCPILCLLKSNNSNEKDKQTILRKLVTQFKEFPFSDKCIKACINLKMEESTIQAIKSNILQQNSLKALLSLHSLSMSDLRSILIKKSFDSVKRIETYNFIKNNDFENFKKNIFTYLDIFEELSDNAFWTTLHYVFYFGNQNFVEFTVDLLKKEDIMNSALKLKTIDSRTPIMCIIKSDVQNIDNKLKLLKSIIKKYPEIIFDEEEVKESIERGFKIISDHMNK